MKFLVDAQLPRRMARWLETAGIDAIHTTDLPAGNRTTDRQITELADREDRIVVTKDADFVDSHLLFGRPTRLLLVSAGNISNHDLESLIVPRLPEILHAFAEGKFVEIGRQGLSTRD